MSSEFAELVTPSHTAILMIDIQNDCCHPDGFYSKRGRDMSHAFSCEIASGRK